MNFDRLKHSYAVGKKMMEIGLNYNLNDNEKQLIRKALNELEPRGYTKKQIASALGVGVATLYRKMAEYGIQNKPFYK